jgi:hypothetical protein
MPAISEAPITYRPRARSSSTEAQSFSVNDGMAKQWRNVLGQLNEIRSLQDDWDEMGAIAPFTAIVDSALAGLYRLRNRRDWRDFPPSRASVAPDGRVIIDWQYGKNYLHAQLIEPDVWEWMQVFENGKVVHSEWLP